MRHLDLPEGQAEPDRVECLFDAPSPERGDTHDVEVQLHHPRATPDELAPRSSTSRYEEPQGQAEAYSLSSDASDSGSLQEEELPLAVDSDQEGEDSEQPSRTPDTAFSRSVPPSPAAEDHRHSAPWFRLSSTAFFTFPDSDTDRLDFSPGSDTWFPRSVLVTSHRGNTIFQPRDAQGENLSLRSDIYKIVDSPRPASPHDRTLKAIDSLLDHSTQHATGWSPGDTLSSFTSDHPSAFSKRLLEAYVSPTDGPPPSVKVWRDAPKVTVSYKETVAKRFSDLLYEKRLHSSGPIIREQLAVHLVQPQPDLVKKAQKHRKQLASATLGFVTIDRAIKSFKVALLCLLFIA